MQEGAYIIKSEIIIYISMVFFWLYNNILLVLINKYYNLYLIVYNFKNTLKKFVFFNNMTRQICLFQI